MSKVKIIVARNWNNIIGINNKIPWKCPQDLKFFKKMTEGHTVIMGRKTWESIGEKPLKNRNNMVLSRSWEDRLVSYPNLNNAISYSRDHFPRNDIWIIGGESVYQQAIKDDLWDEIWVSTINNQALPLPGDEVRHFRTNLIPSRTWESYENTEDCLYMIELYTKHDFRDPFETILKE